MHLMAFYVDGRQRAHRAEMFAGSAAYTGILVYHGYHGRKIFIYIIGHVVHLDTAVFHGFVNLRVGYLNHFDGSGRAVAGTVAALRLALSRDAEVGCNHGVTYLYACFLIFVNGLDGSGRTYL